MMDPAIYILFLLFSVVYIEGQEELEGEEGPRPLENLRPDVCGCRVGFSAYMSEISATTQSLTMFDGRTLVFDQTTANTGYYSTVTGRFRAPIKGTYAFTWTICVDSRFVNGGYGEYGTNLLAGSGVCGYLHTDTETRYDDACSTAFVICRVNANNEVYVRNNYARQGRLLSKNGQTRTAFIGWKLF